MANVSNMNRRFTFFIALALSFFGANAQTVQIGTGTSISATTLFGPVYRFSATSATTAARSDMLWSQSEMVAAGIPAGAMITGIQFNKGNVGNFVTPCTYTVWMGNTSNTVLATTQTWAAITGTFTQVYTSTSFNFPSAAGWMPIPIAPFLYTGGALEIATDQAMGGSGAATDKFSWEYTSTVSTDMIVGAQSAAAVLNSTLLTYKCRPNIKITYTAGGCGTPTAATAAGPAAAVCSGASFNLTATGHSTGTGITYRWQSRPGATGPFTYITGATTVPYSTATSGNTQYRLVTTCGSSNLSDTSNIVTVNIASLPNVDSISETHNAAGVYNFTSHGVTNATAYSWNFGDASPLATVAAPIHPYLASGTYTVRLIVSNGCSSDTAIKILNVVVPPQCVNASGPLTISSPVSSVCVNVPLTITATNAAKGPALYHVWQSSPAGTGVWTTRAVNKDTIFSTFLTASTDFRMVDSCAANAVVAHSNVLPIAIPAAPQITAIARSNNGLIFSYSATGVQNVTTYEWDFGDNTPKSTLPAPTHTYAAHGSYLVTVLVSNGCTSEIRITRVNTAGIGVNTLNLDDEFKLYPNPANEFVNISSHGSQLISDISIMNIMGMEVATIQNIDKKDYQLNTANMPAGNYFLRIKTGADMVNKTFQIIR